MTVLFVIFMLLAFLGIDYSCARATSASRPSASARCAKPS